MMALRAAPRVTARCTRGRRPTPLPVAPARARTWRHGARPSLDAMENSRRLVPVPKQCRAGPIIEANVKLSQFIPDGPHSYAPSATPRNVAACCGVTRVCQASFTNGDFDDRLAKFVAWEAAGQPAEATRQLISHPKWARVTDRSPCACEALTSSTLCQKRPFIQEEQKVRYGPAVYLLHRPSPIQSR
jgi:hypothetical protein